MTKEEEFEVVVKKNIDELNEIVYTTALVIVYYYDLYINKVPSMDSKQT